MLPKFSAQYTQIDQGKELNSDVVGAGKTTQ
jgi:hypothetical protein